MARFAPTCAKLRLSKAPYDDGRQVADGLVDPRQSPTGTPPRTPTRSPGMRGESSRLQ